MTLLAVEVKTQAGEPEAPIACPVLYVFISYLSTKPITKATHKAVYSILSQNPTFGKMQASRLVALCEILYELQVQALR